MSSPFERELEQRLEDLHQQGLHRRLRQLESEPSRIAKLQGCTFLNFASNDYLGLAAEPALKEAAQEAVLRFGAGSAASRLVCGSLKPHHDLEEALACFKGTAAALAFSSGYSAALGTICALLSQRDVVILDKLVHASLVDAARLSEATIRVYRHNDLCDLEDKLNWARRRTGTNPTRVLVVTESVFSMEGDQAPLQAIVGLKEKYGAWLMLDEAHATGLFGHNRRGLAEAASLASQVEVQMGTLGKALGASGGYICGSRPLIDYLINRARPFIFSTAPVPAAAAAATAGIRLVQSADGAARCERLWERLNQLVKALNPTPHVPPSAIMPIHIGQELAALDAAATLEQAGILAPAIRYPSVPRGKARLRITVTASHTSEDISALAQSLRDLAPIRDRSAAQLAAQSCTL